MGFAGGRSGAISAALKCPIPQSMLRLLSSDLLRKKREANRKVQDEQRKTEKAKKAEKMRDDAETEEAMALEVERLRGKEKPTSMWGLFSCTDDGDPV